MRPTGKRLADQYMHSLVPERMEDESVPLSGNMSSGGTNRAKKTLKNQRLVSGVEARAGIEPTYKDLQSSA